ncbi:Alpha/Beta hydrolase protein, partial [Mycena olivaceomarginata]
DPWIIWLQGGPGSSGMIALTMENGPIPLQPNNSWFINEFSWNSLADTIWVDQPVGTGFSTLDSTGYGAHLFLPLPIFLTRSCTCHTVPDEDQTGEDFIGFLSNLVKVFPSLATRPLFLTGESYAGMYIMSPQVSDMPHSSTQNPPTNLRKITIGDGSLGSQATVEHLPIVSA